MVLPALLAALALAQDPEPVPPTPHDRVIELEITAGDEPAIEGHGPTVIAEYEVEFDGTLHVWTTSELDLFLRVDDASEARPLASDDNSGGGTTPHLQLDVEEGDWLVVLVAGDAGVTGSLTLHMIAIPETKAGRLAKSAAQDALREIRRLVNDGRRAEAREIMAQVLPDVMGTAGPDHLDLIGARAHLAISMYEMGDLAAARSLDESVLAGYERILPEGHPIVIRARSNLATSLHEMGDLAGARALRESVLAAYEGVEPEDHPDLIHARANLATSMHAMGDLAGARPLYESVLAARERVLPADHPDLLRARANLATSMHEMGDLAGARAVFESVLAASERVLPEDHPDLTRARANLGTSMQAMGDLAGARDLFESVLEGRERVLPEDHPDLLLARAIMAASMQETGDLAGAHALFESVVAAYERVLPEDHPDLLVARANLATSMHAIGDLAGARALEESALAGYERVLPKDHPNLLHARGALAVSVHDMGDIAGARALEESVLAAYERVLPEDHPDLLSARASLATSMYEMGDLAGARALFESVLAAYERSLPEDHPNLLAARLHVAVSMHRMGDLAGARALYESVLAARERSLPEDHPDLLIARGNLAVSMESMGDLAGARALRESVLAARERSLPEDHPDLLTARTNLAASMHQMGDLAGARALRESVLAAYERSLPEDHPSLLHARLNLANSMSQMGDLAGARALLPKLVAGMLQRTLASLALAPRQARQTVASESHRHSEVLFLSESVGAELEGRVFELTETMRLVAAEAARSLARFETDAELEPILEEAAEVRRALNDLVAGAAGEDVAPEAIAAELTNLSLRRDRLERDASRRLAQRGVMTQPVQADRLSKALGSGDVAIGYRRVAHWQVSGSTGKPEIGADHLMAHALDADGALARIDLGPAPELEELARAWRTALGAPIRIHGALSAASPSSETGTLAADASRGIAVSAGSGGSVTEVAELDAGRSLRSRILDPVLAAVKVDVKRLFICADDLLFLLPLDALPFDPEGEGLVRVGDRLQIVSGVSFARLLAPPGASDGEPSLLSMGGVDYDAIAAVPEGLSAVSPPIESDGASESGDAATRGATGGGFRNLVQAHHEAQDIATIFEDAFDSTPALLTRKKTTKAALFESAPGKRYLHLATHGWFAPESVRSTEDSEPTGPGVARMGIEERVSGLAPMTLCGLALAGANRGRDSRGRVPGILTAEELCSLDLSQCELAVLSACETNVGIRRAGQGIQSLQSALYAAGARTSITSLWKVDDAATRRLFEVFYRSLWIEKMGKADSLWRAKMALRDQGYAVRDWAGWVLTGDPN